MQPLEEFSTSQAQIDYERIEQALLYLEQHFTEQPDLKTIAEQVHLSEFHFERLFSRWAGTSPQRFMRYLTKEYARQLLDQSRDLLDVTYTAGLSSPGRLHDLFVSYEAMTPGEYKNKGTGLTIGYGFHATPFGECLIGLTQRGICGLTFQSADERQAALDHLKGEWPGATLVSEPQRTAVVVEQIFSVGDVPSKKYGKPC
jgi:AraC family transcriptional regulator, regulatory protein of adaptative response / methylated-DNA-[protein]-cysteine methyltransferase